jgi:YVTN family beta-propeller protein
MKRLLIATLLLGTNFLSAAQLPSPALIVLNKGANELVIVDPATQKIIARVPTGEGPHEIALSADGNTAFVGNYGAQTPGSTLSVIDLTAQKELRRVDLGALRRPHGMVEAAGKVYFTVEVNKAVARYDPATDKIDWLMGTGQDATHMVVVNRDQSKIYTSNIASNTVTALERGQFPGGWRATQIATGKGPEAIDLSPDGAELWTAHSQDGGISVIDTATNTVKTTIPAGTKHSNRLKFTPDGKRVLISDAEAGEVVVIDSGTKKVTNRVKVGNVPLGIQISPDGSRAYVATTQDDAVAILDLSTMQVTGKIQTGRNPDGMAWVK